MDAPCCGSVAASEVGNLVKAGGAINAVLYLRILQENLTPSAEKSSLSGDSIFQQYNELEYTNQLLKELLWRTV